jgi:glycosyltransferase involved in cell wall biosynthesis
VPDQEQQMKDGIDISIIIPAHNESRHIMNLLVSIRDNLPGFSYETIVVDNGSSDDTCRIAERYADHVYRIPRGLISRARNFGVSKSSGSVLAFLDADVRLTKTWADELGKRFRQIATADVISGARYRVRENPSYIEWSWFRPLSEMVTNYINGGNLLISRQAFDKTGGFSEQLETGEDVEFCDRARTKGITVSANPSFEVYHDGYPRNLSQFVKREIWHGKGDYSSLITFARSRVAVFSLFFACLHYWIIYSLLYGRMPDIVFALCLILLTTTLMSIRIFHASGALRIFTNLPLCYLYLVSRHLSVFSILYDMLRNYRGSNR